MPTTTATDDRSPCSRLGVGCVIADGGWRGGTLALKERLGLGGATTRVRCRLGAMAVALGRHDEVTT
jgi:hypothetical protein